MREVFAGCGHHDNRHHFTQGRHLKRMCASKDTHGKIIMRLPMSLIANVQSLTRRGTLERFSAASAREVRSAFSGTDDARPPAASAPAASRTTRERGMRMHLSTVISPECGRKKRRLLCFCRSRSEPNRVRSRQGRTERIIRRVAQ
ncbi:hypothetical protein E1301_Tti005494 [Triplophysa tibetana]|uniref:Uncharacterized protein n=1 Tax=Triplophysa tibetana TaxID=1572043 RepID=A0A5A9NE42_9TELE|nr:hypothetical protein E1301_Tti005494 [Triplophysa tibetana]